MGEKVGAPVAKIPPFCSSITEEVKVSRNCNKTRKCIVVCRGGAPLAYSWGVPNMTFALSSKNF